MFERLFTKKNNPEPKKPKAIMKYFNWVFNISYQVSDNVLYEFYKINPFVNAVINKISSDIGANGIEINKIKDKAITQQDISLLEKYIKAYDENLTLKQFLETIVRDVEVLANAYIYLEKDENKNIIAIRRLDPRYIIKVSNEQGETIWYVQNLLGVKAFLYDEIYHIRDNIGVDDETKGTSKLISLFIDLETDKEARESNLAFFRNNQTPSSMVILDDEYDTTDTDTLDTIKDLFANWDHKGGKNHYRSAVLQWVKEIVKVQDKIDEVGFLGGRHFTLQVVCAVYGTTPDVLWFTETSNRAVSTNQSQNHFTTISYKEARYSGVLTNLMKILYPKESYQVVILQDNNRILKDKSDIAVKLYDKWIVDLNEARAIIQYQPVEDDKLNKNKKSQTE